MVNSNSPLPYTHRGVRFPDRSRCRQLALERHCRKTEPTWACDGIGLSQAFAWLSPEQVVHFLNLFGNVNRIARFASTALGPITLTRPYVIRLTEGLMAASPKYDLEQVLDRRFRGPLMSFFLRRTRDREEAEDLTQDVFVRLLAAAQGGGVRDMEALVFVTAANLLKDRGRKTSRRAAAGLDGLAGPDALVQECVEDRDAERVLLAKERVVRYLKALDELGGRTRDIYLLFRLEGMRHKEIAALFNISASTVEKEVMKATLHLARRFGNGNG